MVRIEELRVGSVVRLVSGSPKMAVIDVPDRKSVEVIWWSDRQGLQQETFNVDVLVYPRNDAPSAPDGDAE